MADHLRPNDIYQKSTTMSVKLRRFRYYKNSALTKPQNIVLKKLSFKAIYRFPTIQCLTMLYAGNMYPIITRVTMVTHGWRSRTTTDHSLRKTGLDKKKHAPRTTYLYKSLEDNLCQDGPTSENITKATTDTGLRYFFRSNGNYLAAKNDKILKYVTAQTALEI